MSVLVREHVLEKYLCIFAFSEGVEVENELHTNCIICSLHNLHIDQYFHIRLCDFCSYV